MTNNKLLITRPEPDATTTASQYEARGVDTIICPLIKIEHIKITLPWPDYQAIIATSAHALRALAFNNCNKSTPLYAVGDATAAVAKEYGWDEVYSAQGNNKDLLATINGHIKDKDKPLLYARADHIAGTLTQDLIEQGYNIEEKIVYHAIACDKLSEGILRQLEQGEIGGIVFFSKRTAQIWLDLLQKENRLQLNNALIAYCLSENIAQEIEGQSWRGIKIADKYNMLDAVTVK